MLRFDGQLLSRRSTMALDDRAAGQVAPDKEYPSDHCGVGLRGNGSRPCVRTAL